jgi:hypothetical protein
MERNTKMGLVRAVRRGAFILRSRAMVRARFSRSAGGWLYFRTADHTDTIKVSLKILNERLGDKAPVDDCRNAENRNSM